VNELDRLFQHYIKKAKGYRWFKTITRFFVLSLFGFFVSLRFFLFDVFLLPRWDLGWRPWSRIYRVLEKRKHLKMWLYRGYAFIGRMMARNK
jgi:hypothetical protein